MSTSLNGWPGVATSGPALRRIAIPGTHKSVTTEATCAPLFAAFLAEVNVHVVPLDIGPVDGWEYRQARAADGLSNHASGTAVDVHYSTTDPKWPAWPADNKRHCTDAQIKAMHSLLDKYVDPQGRRVFGWGGDWGKVDEMHVELAQSWATGARGRATTKTDVLAVIKHLGIARDGTVTPAVEKVYVGGRTPVTAREIARILGISWARVIRFNGTLLVSRARPGSAVRIPPGVTPRPIYRGAPSA